MMNFEINELACQCRRDWNIDEIVPMDILNVALNKISNLTISFLDMGKNISGACSKSSSQQVIFINSKHSKARQSFTLAHELYHLKFDDIGINICSLKSNDETEKNADLFASCLLMPHGALKTYQRDNKIDYWDLDSIIACEQYFQISHTALLYRLKDLGEITNKEYSLFKRNVKQNAMMRGYPINLYEPISDKESFTYGNYLRLVEDVFKKDLISYGLKEEFLLEANREDIVYNL